MLVVELNFQGIYLYSSSSANGSGAAAGLRRRHAEQGATSCTPRGSREDPEVHPESSGEAIICPDYTDGVMATLEKEHSPIV